MRQDTAFHAGEAISQKVVGALIAGCVDRVITVDAHLHRTPDIGSVFPGIQSDNLSAMSAIADALRKTGIDPATLVIGPDTESQPWVSDLAGRLGFLMPSRKRPAAVTVPSKSRSRARHAWPAGPP